MTVEDLVSLFKDFDGQIFYTDELRKNNVGNLMILRNGYYIGYIDLRKCTIHLAEMEDENI